MFGTGEVGPADGKVLQVIDGFERPEGFKMEGRKLAEPDTSNLRNTSAASHLVDEV